MTLAGDPSNLPGFLSPAAPVLLERIFRGRSAFRAEGLRPDRIHLSPEVRDQLRREKDDEMVSLFGLPVSVDPNVPAEPGFEISPRRPALEGQVDAAARALGIELSPWQKVVACDLLEGKGPLRYPRQNGRQSISRVVNAALADDKAKLVRECAPGFHLLDYVAGPGYWTSCTVCGRRWATAEGGA